MYSITVGNKDKVRIDIGRSVENQWIGRHDSSLKRKTTRQSLDDWGEKFTATIQNDMLGVGFTGKPVAIDDKPNVNTWKERGGKKSIGNRRRGSKKNVTHLNFCTVRSSAGDNSCWLHNPTHPSYRPRGQQGNIRNPVESTIQFWIEYHQRPKTLDNAVCLMHAIFTNRNK